MKITKVGSSAQAEVHLFLGELSDEHAEWEQIFHELMQDDDEDSHEVMSHLDPWDPVVVQLSQQCTRIETVGRPLGGWHEPSYLEDFMDLEIHFHHQPSFASVATNEQDSLPFFDPSDYLD